jgi:UDP-2,3-diacylglucosamine pyrophosphatase LpxH
MTRNTPLLEPPEELAPEPGTRRPRSGLRILWNPDEAAERPLDPAQARLLLRRQIALLEREIMRLPYGSEQAADWEQETERLLREIFGQAAQAMHPSLYRFKYASPSMDLPPEPCDWQLQNHYTALQKMRQQQLHQILDGLELGSGGAAVAERHQLLRPETQAGREECPPQDLPAGGRSWAPAAAVSAEAPREAETFLFSDLHLGSDVSRCKELLQLLQTYSFRRLILLGDIFDDLNFKRLRRDHWEMLSWLRKLSDPERKVEIVWILGNHDLLLENVSHFVGIEVRDKYVWEQHGRRFLAIHGHQFDRFLEENVVISEIATVLYLLVQKMDTRRQRFSRLLKRMSKKWLRLSRQVALRAARYGRAQGADYVFCGHTHRAVALQLEGVGYYNTGCWTDVPSHYITVDSANRIQLHEHE